MKNSLTLTSLANKNFNENDEAILMETMNESTVITMNLWEILWDKV